MVPAPSNHCKLAPPYRDLASCTHAADPGTPRTQGGVFLSLLSAGAGIAIGPAFGMEIIAGITSTLLAGTAGMHVYQTGLTKKEAGKLQSIESLDDIFTQLNKRGLAEGDAMGAAVSDNT